MSPLWAVERSYLLTLYLGHGLLWLVGLVGIGFGARRLSKQINKRKRAENELKRHKDHLEEQVAERTAELQMINQALELEIAEHKRSEEELRDSEMKVRLLLDSTAEGIYGLDMDGKCVFANRACIQSLKYNAADELIGKNMHDLIHHSYPDATPYPSQACPIFQAFEKGEYVHVDDEVLWRADGTSFSAEYWSYPIKKDGQIKGVVVTFLDITERMQAEEQIKASLKEKEILLQRYITGLRTTCRSFPVF